MAETESNLPPAALGPLLDRLRNAMEASVEPPPGEIARLAATARESLQATAKIDASGRILDRDGYPLQIRAAGQQSPSAVAMQNWDDLCQQVAALAATRRAIADATGGRHFEAEQRLLAIARLLRFQRADRQWPSLFANMTAAKSSATMLNDIGRELDAIRSELLQAALQIGSHP